MDKLLIAIIALFVIYIVADKAKLRSKQKEFDDRKKNAIRNMSSVYSRKNILTKSEYAFFKTLKIVCSKYNLMICPKVRLEDFVYVNAKDRNLNQYRGYIKSRHVDFLLCTSDLTLLAGLELDDTSHNTKTAQETDHFKNNLFSAIGVPLLRVKTTDSYSEKLDELITPLIPTK